MNIAAKTALLLIALPLAAQAGGLTPLSENEMGAVTGQEGILVSLDYYYNSDPTPGASQGSALIGGSYGCSTPDGGASLGNVNCRLALQLENRYDEWLVFKNGHASLVVNRLSLDAAFLGDASSSAITGYYNDGKFKDESGNCLLGTGNCNTGYIANMPGVRAHYPQTGGSYDGGTSTIANGYSDVLFGMFIEGVAVEPNGVNPGWQGNDNGSFLGAKIADNNGHQAGITFGGDFYMYGF